MRRFDRVARMMLFASALAAPAWGVAGTPDRVPAASLLVPFLETGIDSFTHPQDTLLAVTNRRPAERTIHYHVWDIDGNPTALNGNVTLGPSAVWTVAMRDLLNGAAPAVRTQLTTGPFYRGFVTIDAVTAATGLAPTAVGFPFFNGNDLEGFIYYTRLSQGSANGIAMVPLEALPGTAHQYIHGFYREADNREEMDASGRRCAQLLAAGGTCPASGEGLEPPASLHMRIFRSAPLNGGSRGVVFTWTTGRIGGPSTYCDLPANDCSPAIAYRQYDQAGNVVVNGSIRLDHVVNVIEDSSLVGTESGWISITSIPNVELNLQVYGFSFNSANPVASPSLTWDAIFEAYVNLDDHILF